jgi:hypothetical protein
MTDNIPGSSSQSPLLPVHANVDINAESSETATPKPLLTGLYPVFCILSAQLMRGCVSSNHHGLVNFTVTDIVSVSKSVIRCAQWGFLYLLLPIAFLCFMPIFLYFTGYVTVLIPILELSILAPDIVFKQHLGLCMGKYSDLYFTKYNFKHHSNSAIFLSNCISIYWVIAWSFFDKCPQLPMKLVSWKYGRVSGGSLNTIWTILWILWQIATIFICETFLYKRFLYNGGPLELYIIIRRPYAAIVLPTFLTLGFKFS